MSIFRVDCTLVTLSGVILSSHLTLHNPHELLAVIFELQAKPAFLEIEPLRGMIMQGEKKIIKMRCKNEARSSLHKIEREQCRLIIRGSYYSEYNKKVMAKNHLKGWSTVSKELQEVALPIYFNFAEEIEKVREEAHRSHSLKNSRKINSFQKFKQSSIKRTKNQKLNEDLDFIFRNEQFKKIYESKYSQRSQKSQNSPKIMKTSTAPPQLFNNFRHENSNSQILSPFNSPKSQKVYEAPIRQNIVHNNPTPIKVNQNTVNPINKSASSKRKDGRALDLIILAIIAALFVGFGEGVGRNLKY